MSVFVLAQGIKGQIKTKADWRTVDSPKKRTNEFGFFCREKQTNKKQICSFLFWENLWCANLFTVLSVLLDDVKVVDLF
jgi:hypothetical protein